MKICRICKKEKSLDDFSWKYASRGIKQAECKQCMKKYKDDYYAANRVEVIRKNTDHKKSRLDDSYEKLFEYLSSHPCIDCGNSDVRVLEFDHRPEEDKTASVSRLITAGNTWDKILLEINKCDVRCANCHRIVTYERFGGRRHLYTQM